LVYNKIMTDRYIDKLIRGPYKYGTVLANGEKVTIGMQLALRKQLRNEPTLSTKLRLV
jgi:hypothetical protein